MTTQLAHGEDAIEETCEQDDEHELEEESGPQFFLIHDSPKFSTTATNLNVKFNCSNCKRRKFWSGQEKVPNTDQYLGTLRLIAPENVSPVAYPRFMRHFYHCAALTKEDPCLIKRTAFSSLLHLCEVHKWQAAENGYVTEKLLSEGPTKWNKDIVDKVISQKSQHNLQTQSEEDAMDDGMSMNESNQGVSDDEIFWGEEFEEDEHTF
uniref:Uncharacterized protein n=1 Tax=Ditylenchus dipsaci TaxID=166011 RepID=A0A915ECD0_9BILA